MLIPVLGAIGESISEIIIEMPNVFTPNNDGTNDYFLPRKIEGISTASIIIYNRWGQKLFESPNIIEGWDGNFNGGPCSSGTYYWIVQYTDINGVESELKGYLSLLR